MKEKKTKKKKKKKEKLGGHWTWKERAGLSWEGSSATYLILLAPAHKGRLPAAGLRLPSAKLLLPPEGLRLLFAGPRPPVGPVVAGGRSQRKGEWGWRGWKEG